MNLPEALDILGLDQGADRRQLRKAYRRLALRHHPDRVQGAAAKRAAEERFLQVRDAYEFLRKNPLLLARPPERGTPAGPGVSTPPREFEEMLRRYRRSRGVSPAFFSRWLGSMPAAWSEALTAALVVLYVLLLGFLLTWKR